MRSLITSLALTALTASGHAQSWTCAYNLGANSVPNLVHFELTPRDLIDAGSKEHYQVLENNKYGVVAVLSLSKIEKGQSKATVGGKLVVIDKMTGAFWLTATIARPDRGEIDRLIEGKCEKG
jgi:hypothetical protein